MYRILPAPVLGGLVMLLGVLNLMFWAFLWFFPVVLASRVIPNAQFRFRCARALEWIAWRWIGGNNLLLDMSQHVEWDVAGLETLSRDQWYFLVSNHRSWIDIVVLQRILKGRAPLPKFFIKQELRKLPILGACWEALDMPFMQRYTRAQLEANPALRQVDRDATARACEVFEHAPVTITNFLEGTRFTPAKHAKFNSPYRHLLPPKTGGLAYVLQAMQKRLGGILDVTILYAPTRVSLWDLVTNRVRRITVRVRLLPIPDWVNAGDYLGDNAFRRRFQGWLHDMWLEKDRQIDRLLPAGEA